ncbi:MAG: hypothetical protein LBL09_01390 [Oscillospiraceae bacterium]|jgi:hypothetical protein|nr:hypothetical protein [Oscillospiraceae bacterium]
MFAIIDAIALPRNRFKRFFGRFDRSLGVSAEEIPDFKVSALSVNIAGFSDEKERLTEKRYIAAAELILGSGITEVIYPEGLAHSRIFHESGLRLPDRKKLLTGAAGLIAEKCLEETKGGAVSIFATRASSDLDRAVRYLAPRVGKLSICLRSGGEGYCESLRFDYGLSVNMTAEVACTADFYIIYQPPAAELKVTKRPRALVLCEEYTNEGLTAVEDVLVDTADPYEKFNGYDRQTLLTALYGAGAIKNEDIRVEEIIYCPPTKPCV